MASSDNNNGAESNCHICAGRGTKHGHFGLECAEFLKIARRRRNDDRYPNRAQNGRRPYTWCNVCNAGGHDIVDCPIFAEAVRIQRNYDFSRYKKKPRDFEAFQPEQLYLPSMCRLCWRDGHREYACLTGTDAHAPSWLIPHYQWQQKYGNRVRDIWRPDYCSKWCSECDDYGHFDDACPGPATVAAQAQIASPMYQKQYYKKHQRKEFKCNFCNKPGHLDFACYERKRQLNNERNKLYCDYCRQNGHLPEDCPLVKEINGAAEIPAVRYDQQELQIMRICHWCRRCGNIGHYEHECMSNFNI